MLNLWRLVKLILQGSKKQVLMDVTKYFVDTTGASYEDLLGKLVELKDGSLGNDSYDDWLVHESVALLGKNGVSLSECFENKDIMQGAVAGNKSRNEGEFYTPEAWCHEGREYLKEMLGEQWGKVNVWDASCGTGNLMKTADYPQDKMFMSSLLQEDIDIVHTLYPNATCFQLDFLQGIDYDRTNDYFVRKLPKRLQEIIKNNEPLVFFMNPPYKVGVAQRTEVGVYMSGRNMTKCALDIFNQFLYRIIMLKRVFGLTNLYLGIFGPVTVFHSKMLEDLFDDIKQEFVFNNGMFFDAGYFSSTSESVGWAIGYTTWRTKKSGEDDKLVVLESKFIDENGKMQCGGKRPFRAAEYELSTWIEPKDVTVYTVKPSVTTFDAFTGDALKTGVNALGQIMSSSYVIRGTRRCMLSSLPCVCGVDVTSENFWRVVASYTARRVYLKDEDAGTNSQYYSKPEIEIDGYREWVMSGLVLCIFDWQSYTGAYRGYQYGRKVYDVNNFLFPLSREVVESSIQSGVITDENIISDFRKFEGNNKFVTDLLPSALKMAVPEAVELYNFGINVLLDSLKGSVRKDAGYPLYTVSWDACLIQLRKAGIWTDANESELTRLLSNLKTRLLDGLYKYGFVMTLED